MPDNHTPDQRHRNMVAIHSASTRPELKLRHALWRRGFRYHVNVKRLPGSPDIVLPKYHTVIFVHGCFWHGHKGCKYYTIPQTNTDFWVAKVARNQGRDQEKWRQLEAKGWLVIIVWECQMKNAVLEETISRVEAEILRNGEILQQTNKDRRKARDEYRVEMRSRKAREVALKVELRQK